MEENYKYSSILQLLHNNPVFKMFINLKTLVLKCNYFFLKKAHKMSSKINEEIE